MALPTLSTGKVCITNENECFNALLAKLSNSAAERWADFLLIGLFSFCYGGQETA